MPNAIMDTLSTADSKYSEVGQKRVASKHGRSAEAVRESSVQLRRRRKRVDRSD
jgi:hypothetical protein